MPSLLLIQWGIVGFFVLIHFLIGFFRGTLKSGYYTIVSIILTVLILWIVSGISIGNFYSGEELIDLIQSNTGDALPSDYLSYLLSPGVIGLVVAIVDVVIRIALFYVLYTLVKWFLSFVVFGLIWKHGLEKKVRQWFKLDKVLFKEGDEVEDAELVAKKYKSLGNRLGGAAFGAVRGFLTVFVLLMPILVLASTTANITFDSTEQNVTSGLQLSSEEAEVAALISSDIEELIDWLNELNENNFAQALGGLGDSLFDWAFETEFEDGSAFNLRDELNVVTELVDLLNDNGLLDDALDVEALSANEVAVIEQAIALLKQSDLVITALEVGSDVAADGLLEDIFDVDFSSNANAQAALTELRNIDWVAELDNLSALVAAVLEVGSVAELTDLANDPEQIFDFTDTEVEAVSNVLRRLADLQLVKVMNFGIEYAVTLEEATNLVEWLPESERQAYLKDVLANILADTEFFYGENGDLYNLADLVDIILAQYGDFTVGQVLAEDFDISQLFVEDSVDFVEAALNGVAEVQTIVEVLPLAVDFAMYSVLDAPDAAAMTEALQPALSDLDVTVEFNTFADVYAALVTLGAGEFLAADADTIALLDGVVRNNLPAVRTIVDKIFVDSVLVNAALEVGVPIAIDLALEEGDLKSLVEVVMFADGALAFSLGEEIVKVLDMVETLYDATSIAEIMTAMDTGEVAALVDALIVNDSETLKSIIEQAFDLVAVDRAVNIALVPIIDFVLGEGDTNDLLVGILNSAEQESPVWTDEIENLLFAGIDLALLPVTAYESDSLLSLLENIDTLDLQVLTNALDTRAGVDAILGPIFNSLIVRAAVPVLLEANNDALDATIPELLLGAPSIAMDGMVLKDAALLDMLAPLLSMVNDALVAGDIHTIEDLNAVIAEMDTFVLFDAYFGMSTEDIQALAASDFVRGGVSALLMSDAVHQFVYDIASDSGIELSTALKFERDNDLLTAEELGALFTFLHDLNLPKSLIIVPDSRVFLSTDAVFGYLLEIGEDEFEVLFDNVLVNELLSSVLHDEGIVNFALELYDDAVGASVEDTLSSLGSDADVRVVVENLIRGFVNINNADGFFDLREFIPFIEAYQALDISNYNDANQVFNPQFFIDQWEVATTDENLIRAFDSRFIKFPLGFVLSDPVYAALVADLANGLVADFGVTFSPQAFAYDPMFFEADGDLRPEYIAQLAGGVLAALKIDPELTAETIAQLSEVVTVFGSEETVLDHLLNAELLFELIDTVTIEPLFLDGVTAVIDAIIQDTIANNQALSDLLADSGIAPEDIALGSLQLPPEALDEEGHFKRSEIRVFLAVAVELFGADLSNVGSTEGIYNLIKDTQLVELVLESEWINAGIALGLNNPSLFNSAINAIETTVRNEVGVAIDVEYSLLDITEEKYGVFYETDLGNLRIKPVEVKHLILSVLAIDFASLSFGSGTQVIDDVYALLDSEDPYGVSLIDNLLQSNILIALFDKILNFDTDASNVRAATTAVINALLADSLNGEILSDRILEMRNVANELGVIRADEIRKLIELGKLIDTATPLGVDTAFGLFTQDNNGNGQTDFVDIFESNILLSLLSNLVAEPSMKTAGAAVIGAFANDFLDGIDMFDGFDFDASKLGIFFDTLTDDDGAFDYMQFMDIAYVLGSLNLTSMDRINAIYLPDFLPVAVEALYNGDYEGRNGLRFIADIDMLRGLLDAFIFEQDLGYVWGLEFIMGMLADNAPSVDPATVSMGEEMRALDDENGLIEAQHIYEFLLAFAGQELGAIISNNFELGTLLENLYAQPFEGIEKDRLDLFYESQIIDILLSGIADDFTLEAALAGYTNDLIKDAVAGAGYSTDIDVFGYTDLMLSYDWINEDAVRQIINTLGILGIESTDDFANLTDGFYVLERLDLVQSYDYLGYILTIPAVERIIDLVFADEELQALVVDVANQVLDDLGYDGVLTSDILSVGDLVVEGQTALLDDIQLVAAAVIIMATDETFDAPWLSNFGDDIEIADLKVSRFDHVMNSRLLFELVNNVFRNPSAKDVLASVVNDVVPPIFESLGFGDFAGVVGENFYLPDWAFDDEGYIKRSDLALFLAAFNEIGLTSFNDTEGITEIPTIHHIVSNTMFVDYLFSTDLIRVYVGAALSDPETLDGYANMLNDLAYSMGYDLSIDRRILDLTAAKYDLMTYSAVYDLFLLNTDDVKHFLSAVTSVDWLNLPQGTTAPGTVSQIIDLLTLEDDNGMSPLDEMVTSDMLIALLDKVLNIQSQSYDLIAFALEVLEEPVFSTISLLDGVTLSSQLFSLKADALDDNGVLSGEELAQVVRAIDVFVTDRGFEVDRLGFIIASGQIQEVYDSAILTSYISNLLSAEDLKTLAVDFANDAQTFAELPYGLFTYDPSIYDGFFIKVSELEALVNAAYVLGLFDASVPMNVTTLTDLYGSNVDAETNKDDLDRILDAGILYSVLNNVLLYPGLGDIIIDFAISNIGLDMSFIDFTMPVEVIGDENEEPIELNRVTKEAWKQLIVSIGALEIDEALANDAIGLGLITDMIDMNDPENDRFSMFLASDIIYVLLARIIDDAYLSEQLGAFLPEEFAGLLGGISFVSPLDARGSQGVEEDLFSRAEMRKLFESIAYLAIDMSAIDPNFLSYIFNLVDSNIDPNTMEDDFDRFFSSKYIQDKFSAILLSDDIIGLIAGDLFDAQDFMLPAVATFTLGDTTRLVEAEFRNMFVALATIGITDLNNVSLSIEDLGGLTEAELDDVLASDFVYTIIDLILQSQDTIAIPASAIETAGDYVGMVKKAEIATILGALGTDFDPNAATIADLEGLYNEDSAIIDGIITTAVEDLLGTLPAAAYDGDTLLRTEIRAIIDVMLILADQDNTVLLSSFDFANLSVTIADLEAMRLLNSEIVSMLLTDVISETLTIADDAYVDGDNTKALLASELERFVAMLLILTGDDDTVDLATIDFANLTVTAGMLSDLANLNSVIVADILSDVVTSALTVPTGSFDAPSTTRLKATELRAFADMILILVDNVLTTDISTLDFTDLAITTTQLTALNAIESLLVATVLSETITDAIDVPSYAFDAGSTTLIANSEITRFIAAVEAYGVNDIAGLITLDASAISPADLSAMLAEQSLIIFRLVATGIIGTGFTEAGMYAELGEENYDASAINQDIKVSEMTHIASSLLTLGVASLSDIANITVNNFASLTTAEIEAVIDVTDINLFMYYLINDIVATTQNLTLYNQNNVGNEITADVNGRVTKAELVTIIEFVLSTP